MHNEQKKQEYKYSEARIRANQKYANSKWRPNIFIDKELQPNIEKHFKEKGYKSFNEYVIALVLADMGIEKWIYKLVTFYINKTTLAKTLFILAKKLMQLVFWQFKEMSLYSRTPTISKPIPKYYNSFTIWNKKRLNR